MNRNERFSVPDVARYCNVSESYLFKIFNNAIIINCIENSINYSRYMDDMFFSCDDKKQLNKIENFAPLESQENWDASGWVVETENPEVNKIMFALTVNDKDLEIELYLSSPE